MTNPNLRISLRSATPRISRCTDLYDEAGKDSISVDTVKRARRALQDELNIVVEDRRGAGRGVLVGVAGQENNGRSRGHWGHGGGIVSKTGGQSLCPLCLHGCTAVMTYSLFDCTTTTYTPMTAVQACSRSGHGLCMASFDSPPSSPCQARRRILAVAAAA